MLLHARDLIEDREVSDERGDRLAHSAIAAQLAQLVRGVTLPANIALYGPWGSGKTGIGNLLRDAIDGKDGIRFARFDAFKYAETPLRRNFISAVADQLGNKKEKYHRDLYSAKTRTAIGVPPIAIGKAILVFALFLFLTSFVVAAVVAIVAAVQADPFGDAFSRLGISAVTAGLLPAALLSALITLASKTLQVDRSTGKPESDEQFEEIFTGLVKECGAERLVIFVDEVDRCAADEVVATLDAIRTFLGVNKCVFIIAADQQVLEQGLTLAARQETPANEVNPYYSLGSAYLDKVFQYQVALPPLMTQRVTEFAAGLVRGREGVWSAINSDFVASVLVPTHVTSPRRVKHLLNAFALTYRLAESRHAGELLAAEPKTIAPSIAKLVCLRVEFPIFARDLEIDFRLPEMVLSLMQKRDYKFDSSFSGQAIQRAKAYALSKAEPATVIIDEELHDGDAIERTVAHSNQQLLDYLRRTATVPGPARDLVYMYSGGAAFGLDSQTASEVEAASDNADITALQTRLKGADERTRNGIMEMLSHQMRTSLGVGGPNAARTLLLLLDGDSSLPLERIADLASEAIALHIRSGDQILSPATIEAAWTLAASASESGAFELRRQIIRSLEDESSEIDGSFVLMNPGPALDGHREELGQLAAREIVREGGDDTVENIGALNNEQLVELIEAMSDYVSEALSAAIDELQAYVDATEKANAATAAGAAAAAAAEAALLEADEPFRPKAVIDAILELARKSMRDDTRVTNQLILLLLRVDRQDGRDAVEELLQEITPIDDEAVANTVLLATQRRVLNRWPVWLNALQPSVIRSQDASRLQEVTRGLWSHAKGLKSTDLGVVEAAVGALMTLIEQLPDGSSLDIDATESVANTLSGPIEDSLVAETRSTRIHLMQPLIDAHLVDEASVCGRLLSSLDETLSIDYAEVIPDDSALARYLLVDAPRFLRMAARDGPSNSDLIRQIITKAASFEWISQPMRAEVALGLAHAADTDGGGFASLPDLDEVRSFVESFGTAASRTVELWLSVTKPGRAELTSLFELLRNRSELTAAIASSAADVRSLWTRDDQIGFLSDHVNDPNVGRLDADEVKVLGLDTLDQGAVANVIVERFIKCSNNTQRKGVIDLWRSAQVSDEGARRRLIREVVIPLLRPAGTKPQAGMTELALDGLQLLGGRMPTGPKGALGQALKAALSGQSQLENKALRILEPLGYETETTGWFRKTKKVKFSGDGV